MRFTAPVRFQQQQSTKLGIFADITKADSHKKDDEARLFHLKRAQPFRNVVIL